MLVLVALAVVEEMLWDALVFQDYLPSLCRNMTAAPPAGEAATHSGLHFSSRFGGRGLEHTYQAGERSPRRGGSGWLCDRLWGEEDGASVDDEGDEEGKLPLLDFEATGIALFTAALATPQIVHYVLDGYCWRLDRSPYLSLQPLMYPPQLLIARHCTAPLQVHLAVRPQPATTRVPIRRRGPRCGRGRGVRRPRRDRRRHPHGGGEEGQGRELPPTRQPPAAHRGADRCRGRRVESCAPRPELKCYGFRGIRITCVLSYSIAKRETESGHPITPVRTSRHTRGADDVDERACALQASVIVCVFAFCILLVQVCWPASSKVHRGCAHGLVPGSVEKCSMSRRIRPCGYLIITLPLTLPQPPGFS